MSLTDNERHALNKRMPADVVRAVVTTLQEKLAPAQAVVDGVCVTLETLIPEIEALQSAAAEPPPEVPEIKLGAIVHLRSGGPNMTVSREHPDHVYACTWFDEETRQMNSYGFPEAALKLGAR